MLWMWKLTKLHVRRYEKEPPSPPPSRRATQPHRISSDLERAAPALSCPRRAASAEAQVKRA